jgi:hypothetical protein
VIMIAEKAADLIAEEARGAVAAAA